MNMIIRVLLLPLSLTLVAIAGMLGTVVALFLAIAKSFDNSSFNKEVVSSPEAPQATEIKAAPSPIKH